MVFSRFGQKWDIDFGWAPDFGHFSLKQGMGFALQSCLVMLRSFFFKQQATFYHLSIRPSRKALHTTFNISMKYDGTNYKAGLKQGIDFMVSLIV